MCVVKELMVYGLPRSGTNYLEFLVRNNPGVTILVFHEDLVGRDELFLKHVSRVFGIGLKDCIVTSSKRTDRSGGCGFKPDEYIFIQSEEVPVNGDYDKIKELKWI